MSNSKRFDAVKRAVFLDRDGTVNVEKDYLYRPEEFEFIPGAPDAIRQLNEAGWLVVVITNQSGVARGYYGEKEIHLLHTHIENELRSYGAHLDGSYYCPHHPDGDGPYNIDCACRKPLPGMLLRAASDLDIDLSRSWMVGDKVVDIEAGMAAGCRQILVRTGYGETHSQLVPAGVTVCDDISEAVRLITSN